MNPYSLAPGLKLALCRNSSNAGFYKHSIEFRKENDCYRPCICVVYMQTDMWKAEDERQGS